MRGVEPSLAGLRPIALLQFLGNEGVRGGQRQELELRDFGPVFGRAEISPNETAGLACGISEEMDVFLGPVARRSWLHGRHREAASIGGELPAMIGAAYASVFIAAEEQIGAAMRAAWRDEADTAI